MEFEVIPTPAAENTPPDDSLDINDMENRVHIFRAHRVIVGSRCEWFNKALSSGMQESINR